MSDEKMREEFNKLAKEFGYDLTRGYSQEYSYQTTQNVWKLWQASAAHSAARIAELEREVERLNGIYDEIENRALMAKYTINCHEGTLLERLEMTFDELRATSDKVSRNNAELEGQVAMLRKELKAVEVVRMNYEESSQVYFTCPSCELNEGYAPEVVKHDPKCGLNNALSATAQTAEEYRRRVKSEAKIGLLHDMIEDLRGTDCAYYPMDLQAIIHTIEDDALRNPAGQAEGKGEK